MLTIGGPLEWVRDSATKYRSVHEIGSPCWYIVERTAPRVWEIVRIRSRNKKMAKGTSIGHAKSYAAAREVAATDALQVGQEALERDQVKAWASALLSAPHVIDGILDACARVTKVPGAAEEMRSPAMREKLVGTIDKLARGRFRNATQPR